MGPALLDASFLVLLEKEVAAGRAGPAMRWLRAARGRADRALIVSVVTVAEYLEGADDPGAARAELDVFVWHPLGARHADRCAEIQRRARQSGRRLGENDAWQVAVADRAGATIVGRDDAAFKHLGARYERV